MRPESLEKETGQTDGSKDRSGRGAQVPALEDRTAGSGSGSGTKLSSCLYPSRAAISANSSEKIANLTGQST